MKKVLIINGPNLNLLGIRNTEVYGDTSFKMYLETLKTDFKEKVEISYHQTNHEGEIIDLLHDFGFRCDGIVLNAGGYTHTSVAIRDAIEAVNTEVVEVHISNIYARESFRHTSLISAVCKGQISGFGLDSYKLALNYFI